MRPVETSTSDFADLRRKGCIYVDKTAYFHRLISDPGMNICFLARPRRFGKSLMITALKAIFQGRRELFDGLAIAESGWDWSKTWPVLHFNFGDVDTTSMERFERSFPLRVEWALKGAGYAYDRALAPADNFAAALEALSAANGGNGAVVLIDEYDAPVSHALGDIEKAEKIREALSAFYYVMKDRTGSIRFLMMTGVSKFTKMSVFSTLNNIVDVSQDDAYATMLGYTEEELTANFEDHLRAHAEKMGKPYDEYRAEMKRWYNGFRFAREDPTTVYNPISVALTLAKKQRSFSATWSSTGRPSSLMNCLKRRDMLAIDPEATKKVTERAFDVTDLANLKPIGMLYQTGYLTIKDWQDGLYTLGVPDEEVRQDLCLLLTGVAADKDVAWAAELGANLVAAEWDDFFLGLKSLYAAMAYGSTERSVHENSYGRCLAFLLASQGFRIAMEDVQSDGRADIVANHVVGTYIFELKVGEPVDRAFAQIRSKNYAAPYLASGKPIWLVGLSFDPATRRLADAAAAEPAAPKRRIFVEARDAPPAVDGDLGDWKDTPRVALDGGKGRAARISLAHDGANLYVAADVDDPTPMLQTGEDWQTLFVSGDCVDVMLAGDDAKRRSPRECVAGDRRLLFSVFCGKPVCVLYEPVTEPRSAAPVQMMATSVDSVRIVEGAKVCVRRREDGSGYALEAAVPLAEIGALPARGDVGVIFSGSIGGRELRLYHYNGDTWMTDDLTTEAKLQPHEWGPLVVAPAPSLFTGPWRETRKSGAARADASEPGLLRVSAERGATRDAPAHVSVERPFAVEGGAALDVRYLFRASGLQGGSQSRKKAGLGYAEAQLALIFHDKAGKTCGRIHLAKFAQDRREWREVRGATGAPKPLLAPENAVGGFVNLKFTCCEPTLAPELEIDGFGLTRKTP